MTTATFKFIEQKVLRILHIKKDKKEVGNISYYRNTNSEINDVFDINLLNKIKEKFPESTLDIIKINTNTVKEQYENIIIRKANIKPVSIHWVQEVVFPDSVFAMTGQVYPTKKTLFSINVATGDNNYLNDLEKEYEVLVPASDENEKLMTTFLPIL